MKKRSFWIKIIGTIVAIALFFVPIPYYLEGPGEAFALEEMITVGGEADDSEGSFMMTTVGIVQATPLTFFGQFLPNYDGVTQNEMLSGTENTDEYLALQEFYMDNSAHTALTVAFEAANEPVEFNYNGVYVMQVVPESDFSDSLQIGDIIHKIDGKELENSQQFIDYVSNLDPSQEITIDFERNGEQMSTSGQLIPLPDTRTTGIGIGLVDNTTIKTDPEVEIDSGNIGGPSAGLMYSLQIYSQLEENLLNGHKIAGTGTISSDGSVGRIGGVDKKVVTAADDNVDYFLAPDDEVSPQVLEEYPGAQSNYEQAQAKVETMNTDMKVVPIEDFNEAVEFLNQLEPAS